MKLVNKFIGLVQAKFGLFILIVLLSIITITVIKPGFYLIGWDNYSSYFQPGINIFRTFFSTWRDYRGLGVASDAEVTDVFRQLLFVPLGFVLPRELLDQAYYLIALWLGVLGMYAFAGMIARDLPNLTDASTQKRDVFGCIVGLFYLFNLNTLSVFYSPIIPFTNRFYSLPVTLVVFLWFRSKPTWLRFFVVATMVIVTSGSYITPTVVITALMAFGIFLLFRFSVRQTILYSVVFLALNAFWIFPFINYTVEKASIVALARTFVEINESTLNKPASDFSWDKQMVLRPSFFDLNFHTLDGQPFPIHPLLDEYTKPPWRIVLFLFPLLYAIGTFVLLIQGKKARRAFWIPAWIAMFIFLSMKEFSPLGFVYVWLKDHVPFFDVIFRISDTKFHAYVSLAGSIAAAYAIMVLFSFFRQRRIQVFLVAALLIVGLGYTWPFRTYGTGNLIGTLALNKMPSAYFDIAQVINVIPGEGRVLHLPMDQWHSYWRSFSWGYVGSSFFHYLINKPYIDKTFEPASMENAFLHEEINSLINSFYRSSNPGKRTVIAQQFARLLRKTGVQFVILDESISSSVYQRNLTFDAKQYYGQASDLLTHLAEVNDAGITLRGTYTVTFNGGPGSAKLDLYEVASIVPTVSAVGETGNIDPGIANSIGLVLDQAEQSIIVQDAVRPSGLMPFRQQNHVVARKDGTFSIQYVNPNPPLSYHVRAPETDIDAYMVDVYGKQKAGNVVLSFTHRYLPDINDKKFSYPVGSITLPLTKEIKARRIKLNDVILPLPKLGSDTEVFVGTFMLHERLIRASLYRPGGSVPVDFSSFVPTQPLSCFGGPTAAFEGDGQGDGDTLRLTAKSGSSCMRGQFVVPQGFSGKRMYAEVVATLAGTGAMQAYGCVKEGVIEDCLNGHRVRRVTGGETSWTIALQSLVVRGNVYTMDIGVVNPMDTQQTLTVNDARVLLYEGGIEKTLAFTPYAGEEAVTISGPLTLSFPKAISAYSYFHDPETDGFYIPLNSCRGDRPVPRVIRYEGDTAVSRMVNCGTHFAQWFRYASDRPYLFAYEYWLGSGQQPLIVLGKKSDNYFFERASLYQGYPNIAGMKELQNGLRLTSASRFIEPNFFSDSAPTEAAVHLFQDTANEGVLAVRSFDMVEYPAAWQGMTLVPDDSLASYPLPQTTYSIKQMLPSLWNVEGDVPVGSLLRFNRGFDRQWGIYDSLRGVAFGKSLASSIRCDGFANCFRMPVGRVFYIFYTPERLSLFGWAATLATIVVLAVVIKGKIRVS